MARGNPVQVPKVNKKQEKILKELLQKDANFKEFFKKVDDNHQKNFAKKHLKAASVAPAFKMENGLVVSPLEVTVKQVMKAVPTAHPRIFFPSRMDKIKSWLTANADWWPTDPYGSIAYFLAYGDQTPLSNLIEATLSFNYTDDELANGVSFDNYRWSDWIPPVFDAAFDIMDPARRTAFMNRYTYIVQTIQQKSWGGPGMPWNNYFWGYCRNEINWALAIWHELPDAAAQIWDFAINTRLLGSFVPFYKARGHDGAFWEGTEYGKAEMDYPLALLMTLNDYGIVIPGAFLKNMMEFVFYTASNTQVFIDKVDDCSFQPFAYYADESNFDSGHPDTNNNAYGDLATAITLMFPKDPMAKLARSFLIEKRPPVLNHFMMLDNGTPDPVDKGTLPKYLTANSAKYHIIKSGWGADEIEIFIQGGRPAGWLGHNHKDSGNFAIRFGSTNLVKEFTGYYVFLKYYNDTSTLAHNCLRVNGLDQAMYFATGDPVELNQEVNDQWAHLAYDLFPIYKATRTDTEWNPNILGYTRQYLWDANMRLFLTYDQVEVADPSDVVDVNFHTEDQGNWLPEGRYLLSYKGKELSVVPGYTGFDLKVIDDREEAPPINPLCLGYVQQMIMTGDTQHNLLNIYYPRTPGDPDLNVTMGGDDSILTAHIVHPTRGEMNLVLSKTLGDVSASW